MKAILSLALCAVTEATGKPAMELRLAPPADIYPEVQAAIRALDAKREATQAQELAAIDAAGARSFIATAQDDVAVKVLPAAGIPHSIIRQIEALEAQRADAEAREVQAAVSKLRGGRSFLSAASAPVDVVVGASEKPWPRVATLVDDGNRRDQAEHQLRMRILEKLH